MSEEQARKLAHALIMDDNVYSTEVVPVHMPANVEPVGYVVLVIGTHEDGHTSYQVVTESIYTIQDWIP